MISFSLTKLIIACSVVIIVITVLSYLLYTTKKSLQNERKIMKEYNTSFKKEIGDNEQEIGDKGNEIRILENNLRHDKAMVSVLLGLFGEDIWSEILMFTDRNAQYVVAKNFNHPDTNDIKINAERSLKELLKQIKPGFKYTVTFPPQGTQEGEGLY
jgi:hypothetical protein